jgi:DDE domain
MGPQIGREFANRIRQRASRRGDKWHLDEVVISIAGKKHWLWRAVDQDGLVLDILVQSRRDKKASHHTRRWHYRRRRPNRYPLIESSCFGRNRRTRRKRATSASAPSFEPVSQQTLPWRKRDSNRGSPRDGVFRDHADRPPAPSPPRYLAGGTGSSNPSSSMRSCGGSPCPR